MARQIPRLGKDVFTSMMWTGLALKLYDGPELSRGLVEDDGQVVPAMPPSHAPPKDDFCTIRQREHSCGLCQPSADAL